MISSWFLITLALLGANLPFVNQRLLLVIPLRGGHKSAWIRLAEMLVWYLLIGVVARLLESNQGGTAPQNWEFYAITVCLFVVLAFPGFVWRYLRKSSAPASPQP